MKIIMVVVSSYLIGSIPFAYIVSRLFSHIDIRAKGSGNAGATNVLRIVGPAAGVVVLLLDIIKGLAVIKLTPLFINEGLVYLTGFAVISGHCWSPFLKFKGGKGVAVTLGVLLAIKPAYLLYAVLIWLIVFAVFKIVSLASITSALFLPLVLIIKGEAPLVLFFITLYSAVIIFRHHQNIVKLIRGQEKKLQFSKRRK